MHNIRRAHIDDYHSIQRLLESCALPSSGVLENLNNFLVAEYDGIAGVIGLEKSGASVLIRSLAVSADRREQGIGALLVNELLKQVRREGFRNAYLLTGTAKNFLKRWGFEVIDRSEIPSALLQNSTLYTACPGCSTCMKLTLT